MKAWILGLILVCVSLDLSAQTIPTNYLDESYRILAFKNSYANTSVTFTVNAKGIPQLDNGSTDVFQNELTAFIAAYKTSVSNQNADTSTFSKQFLYLNFLIYDKNPADWLAAAKSFPVSFSCLLNITGIAESGSSLTTDFNTAQTALITGITDFVLSRAKQELVDIYLKQWYDRLSTDDVIAPLLPQTLSTVNSFINSPDGGIAAYGDKFKSSFQHDLGNLPVVFEDEPYVDKVLAKVGVDNTSQIGPAIAGGDKLIYELALKKHLVNVISDMSGTYLTENSKADFKKLVVTGNILLSMCGQMTKNNTTYAFVTGAQIKEQTAETWPIVLELAYLRLHDQLAYVVGDDLDATVANLMRPEALPATLSAVSKLQTSFMQLTNLISTYQNTISGTNAGSAQLNINDVQKLLEVGFQTFDVFESFQETFDPTNAATIAQRYKQQVKPYFTFFSQIGEGVQTKTYSDVLDGTIGLLNLIVQAQQKSNVTVGVMPAGSQSLLVVPKDAKVTVVPNTTANGEQLVAVTVDAKSSPAATGALPETIQYLQRYGSFMLNVLSAKDGTAVSSALDELVPQGDYKLKNAPATTIALSAYPGLFGGIETISEYPTDPTTGASLTNRSKVHNSAFAASVYLPIGFDLNFGCPSNGNSAQTPKYNSWGLFVQAVDLGAVLNYRLGGDSNVSSEPNVTLSQIFSPGFSIIHHFTNSPIVIGGGVNYGPDLRKINQDGNSYTSDTVRVGLFIAVDVTFFNINVSKHGTK